ncbi:MAG: heterodisulfide reductase-related iron-sulfur binding cluster [Pseudomonadota bacterium]
MEQAELYALEAQCTQEEPPHCRAMCPLHFDVREFCKLLATRNMRKAWTLLCKTVPLPTLMARICDQPCAKACLRGDLGGAVEIAKLERACAELSGKATPPPALPNRGRKVTVFGHDLASLAAASDMVRKGIEVHLYCAGAVNAGLDGLALPQDYVDGALQEFLDAEIDALKRVGVQIHENTELNLALVENEVERAGVVFVGPSAYEVLCTGMPEPDSITLGTVMTGVFASQGPRNEDGSGVSPVMMAAIGRRAAVSIDRYHQKASLTIGREREGIFASKLFTSLDGVESTDIVKAEGKSYSETELRAEAKRCLRCECMHCVNHCEYLKSFGSYPKQYTRRIYNNEAVVMGTRLSNKLINSCMTCGLCSTICPEHFDMGQLCLTTRQSMVRKGIMPPSAHEFALRDMAFANGEACALVKHEPDHASSSWLFFPGCQLGASSPDNVENAWNWLRKTLPSLEKDKSGVGIMLHCCGAPAHWAGREELFHENLRKVAAAWEVLNNSSDKPTVVTACPSCARMFAEHLPEIPVQSFWQCVDNAVQVHGVGVLDAVHNGSLAEALALHDPCGTRENDEVRLAVRNILQSLEIHTEEPALSGRTTECCGFGGLSAEANPELGKAIIKGRADRLGKVAAKGVTYCAMCRDRLAGAAMPTAHMLDILFNTKQIRQECCGQANDCDAYARPAPTYSERRENRVALRDHLVTSQWAESPSDRPAWASVQVRYTEAAQQAMHERRIMDSDIKKVLHYVEQEGRWLVNTNTDDSQENQRLASFRPNIVTYWVEFTPDPDLEGGWLVHNTWCHRMHILNRKKG